MNKNSLLRFTKIHHRNHKISIPTQSSPVHVFTTCKTRFNSVPIYVYISQEASYCGVSIRNVTCIPHAYYMFRPPHPSFLNHYNSTRPAAVQRLPTPFLVTFLLTTPVSNILNLCSSLRTRNHVSDQHKTRNKFSFLISEFSENT
jgi:hypothetical protein